MPKGQSTAIEENPKTAVKPVTAKPARKPNHQPLPPYHVVLLDDNQHTYQYVITMLGELFAHPLERAFEMAKEVDSTGRVIVLTTHKERAELKRDQIHAFGKDALMTSSKGSMSAMIEPAES